MSERTPQCFCPEPRGPHRYGKYWLVACAYAPLLLCVLMNLVSGTVRLMVLFGSYRLIVVLSVVGAIRPHNHAHVSKTSVERSKRLVTVILQGEQTLQQQPQPLQHQYQAVLNFVFGTVTV